MEWNEVVEKLNPFVFQIQTPSGSGTGFLCHLNDDKSVWGIATAKHVIAHANHWQQPIRLIHAQSKRNLFFKENQRVIYAVNESDTALIVIGRPQPELNIPEHLIPFLPANTFLPIGKEIGWLGFPGMESGTLCFFSGSVSARKGMNYLVDGVAIHGVSGGPVVSVSSNGLVQVIGVISAYRPNKAGGETLPGLSLVQDVTHFHAIVKHLTNMEDAKRKAEEARRKQEEQQLLAQQEAISGESPDAQQSGSTEPTSNAF